MIKVLFFARLREQLNCEQLELELTDDRLTIADVKQQLVTLHPDWQSYLQDNAILNAVNQQMANDNTSISNGDEVAFFPPVTGG